MDEGIKRRWLERLRDGSRHQGRNRLETIVGTEDGGTVSKFCCLGVLCELAVEDGIIDRHVVDDDVPEGRRVLYDGDVSYPTDRVLRWAGLEDYRVDETRDLVTEDGARLAKKNDGGDTFIEIAQLIEHGL